jgi:hypothetical protein
MFGVTIFLGAFLLFQSQLLIGKYILPWYGGVPMVWTACMLCFQVALLLGYAYAHAIVRLPGPRQRLLHLVAVAGSLVLIAVLATRWSVPLLPGPAWKPLPADAPLWHIVQVLTVAIGAPFLVAATTSPLLQSWFGTTYPTTSPYRLYALSNLGSLLALLTYPALFEVWLPLRAQAWGWTAGFVVFALGIAGCALATRSRSSPPPLATARGDATPVPRVRDWLSWLALSACPSALLLATTNYVSQEIAVVPFLWIIPLGLYLASFVLTFDGERWYVRGAWATLLALGVTLSAFVLGRGTTAHVLLQLGVAALALFAACVVCHGELARTKPAVSHLTSFYLAITIGGALGGVLVSLVAPVVFPGTWEYPLGLWLVAGLALVAFARDRRSPLHVAPGRTLAVTVPCALAVAAYVFRWSLPWTPPEVSDAWLFGAPAVVAGVGLTSQAWVHRRGRPDVVDTAPPRRPALVTGAVGLAVVVVGIALGHVAWQSLGGAVEHARSFYGIVHVEVHDPVGGPIVRLRHGRIVHGTQYRSPDQEREPTSYYGRDSGIGLAIEHHPKREAGLRIGVVGLGAGTLAAYGRAGDALRFYELNPDVTRLAGRDGRTFTFVRDSEAAVEIVGGDARVALEAELARGAPQRFDVLAIDAFSSNAIPAHLLTREAIAVYLAHLDAGGILALHITNRHVDLEPVVRGLARHFGLAHVFVAGIGGAITWKSDWALLARDPARLEVPEIEEAASTEPSAAPVAVWTDDHSNLLSRLRW